MGGLPQHEQLELATWVSDGDSQPSALLTCIEYGLPSLFLEKLKGNPEHVAISAILRAGQKGYVGIVNALHHEYGIPLDTWSNSLMKYAVNNRYKPLEHYLLSHGITYDTPEVKLKESTMQMLYPPMSFGD